MWGPGSTAEAQHLAMGHLPGPHINHLFQMILLLLPYYCWPFKSDHFYFPSSAAQGNEHQQVP